MRRETQAKERRLQQQDSGLLDCTLVIDILSIKLVELCLLCLIVVVQLWFYHNDGIAALLRNFADGIDSNSLALTHWDRAQCCSWHECMCACCGSKHMHVCMQVLLPCVLSRVGRVAQSLRAATRDSATRLKWATWRLGDSGPAHPGFDPPEGQCTAGSLVVTLQLSIFNWCTAQASILSSLASQVAAIILLFE